ncbi:MAG TPA: ABC transporter ATP-binding protein [Candidatus Limnocylindrales bacterium]
MSDERSGDGPAQPPRRRAAPPRLGAARPGPTAPAPRRDAPVRPATTTLRRESAPAHKRERGAPVPPPPVLAEGETALPISTRGLTKRYGDLVAVDGLDLDVLPGEIFGLLGQNGAGKTTTILMLLGLTEPSHGWARVAGFDPEREPLEVKRRVGYLPDAVGFYGAMSGRGNLRYTARLNRIERREAEARIDEVLDQVGMSNRADDRVETYSRGMLQRLGIADALLKDPTVLILDEPTTAIDPIGVVEILDLLRRLTRERGLAILLSSHLLSQVQSVCDRVGIFAAGRLVGVGTVPELADQFGEADDVIEVGLEGEADPTPVLTRIPSVRSVVAPDRVGDPWLVRAERDTGTRVRIAILALAANRELALTSVREVVPSLDDIYRRALEARGLAAHGRVAA